MNVQAAVRQIRAKMRDAGYSESTLAGLVKIPQSTIYRSIRSPVRLTKTHRALCKFLGIELEPGQGNPETRDELVQELLEVWDGSREHAHTLARLLRSAAALQAHAASQAARTR
jgi:hypothetical protein